MSGGSSWPLGERRDRQRLKAAVGHAFHCRLMWSRVLGPAVPDPDHVLAGTPFIVFCQAEADDCSALRADEVLAGDADGPAEAGGLRDDLVERVHRFRPADPRDRLHLFTVLEKLHTERYRPQLQQPLEIGGGFAQSCFVSAFLEAVRRTLSFARLSVPPIDTLFSTSGGTRSLREFGLRRANGAGGVSRAVSRASIPDR